MTGDDEQEATVFPFPMSVGPGAHVPLPGTLTVGSAGSPPPATPEPLAPLTPDETDLMETLRSAFYAQETLGDRSEVRVALMRVSHEGYDRAVVALIRQTGDSVDVMPVALLMDPALFEGMTPPSGAERVSP